MKFNLQFTFFFLMFYSCDKQKVEIPSYIHIEKIDLNVTNSQGTASHKITDAWVFVDDNLQGVYELPVTFPVIKTGKYSLKIKAGIKDNGIAATRVQYPFFDFYNDNNFEFIAGSVVAVNPVANYYSTTKFPWLENFETPGIGIDSVYPSSLNIQHTFTDVFEGNASGKVSLNENFPVFKGASSASFSLPAGGTAVYLELNYKTTVSVNVDLISYNPTGVYEDFVLKINSTNNDWKKIYVNLTPAVSGNPYAANYRIAFYSNINDESLISAEIYFDNIKLVHP